MIFVTNIYYFAIIGKQTLGEELVCIVNVHNNQIPSILVIYYKYNDVHYNLYYYNIILNMYVLLLYLHYYVLILFIRLIIILKNFTA